MGQDSLVGQLFEGKYEIDSILGQGGMGLVYKAKHVLMNKVVAIKTLVPGTLVDSRALMRFTQEARAASNLTHPNIISIFDFGVREDERLAYLVMEFLSGKTLEDVIVTEETMSLSRFQRIFSQVCRGMQYAHKRGCIHRDLKPSNLMLINTEEEEDLVKILDFGLAKPGESESMQQLTKSGMVVGSPPFMSPEQCKGEPVDSRSDIYSIGCVMYATLTGEVPLMGTNTMATLFKHIADVPQPVSQIAPHLEIPAALDKVIMRTLEKKPDDRPQSMAELADELSNAIGQQRPDTSYYSTTGYPKKEVVIRQRLDSTPTMSLPGSGGNSGPGQDITDPGYEASPPGQTDVYGKQEVPSGQGNASSAKAREANGNSQSSVAEEQIGSVNMIPNTPPSPQNKRTDLSSQQESDAASARESHAVQGAAPTAIPQPAAYYGAPPPGTPPVVPLPSGQGNKEQNNQSDKMRQIQTTPAGSKKQKKSADSNVFPIWFIGSFLAVLSIAGVIACINAAQPTGTRITDASPRSRQLPGTLNQAPATPASVQTSPPAANSIPVLSPHATAETEPTARPTGLTPTSAHASKAESQTGRTNSKATDKQSPGSQSPGSQSPSSQSPSSVSPRAQSPGALLPGAQSPSSQSPSSQSPRHTAKIVRNNNPASTGSNSSNSLAATNLTKQHIPASNESATSSPLHVASATQDAATTPSNTVSQNKPALSKKAAKDFAQQQSIELKARARQALANEDISTAKALYRQCLEQEQAAIGQKDARLLLTIAELLACYRRDDILEASNEINLALNIYTKSPAPCRAAVNESQWPSNVWRPLAASCFEMYQQAQGDPQAYLGWSVSFYELAINSWQGPKADPSYGQLAKSFLKAARESGNEAKIYQARREVFGLGHGQFQQGRLRDKLPPRPRPGFGPAGLPDTTVDRTRSPDQLGGGTNGAFPGPGVLRRRRDRPD